MRVRQCAGVSLQRLTYLSLSYAPVSWNIQYVKKYFSVLIYNWIQSSVYEPNIILSVLETLTAHPFPLAPSQKYNSSWLLLMPPLFPPPGQWGNSIAACLSLFFRFRVQRNIACRCQRLCSLTHNYPGEHDKAAMLLFNNGVLDINTVKPQTHYRISPVIRDSEKSKAPHTNPLTIDAHKTPTAV